MANPKASFALRIKKIACEPPTICRCAKYGKKVAKPHHFAKELKYFLDELKIKDEIDSEPIPPKKADPEVIEEYRLKLLASNPELLDEPKVEIVEEWVVPVEETLEDMLMDIDADDFNQVYQSIMSEWTDTVPENIFEEIDDILSN